VSIIQKDQLRVFIKENNLNDVNDVYDTLKDMFKDVLQEMLESELDKFLGYSKLFSLLCYIMYIP
jgi:hypothetical protein